MNKMNNYKKALQFVPSKKYLRKMKKRAYKYHHRTLIMHSKYATRLLIRKFLKY